MVLMATQGTASAQTPVQEGPAIAAPNATRLFYGPTARTLPQGQGYVCVYELILPFVQYGVTDRISIGGGTPLWFGFDKGSRPFYITPKVQLVNTGRTQVAVGAMHAFVDGFDGGGVAYGVVTRGDNDKSITASTGVFYADGAAHGVIVSVGGERRITDRIRFITENAITQTGHGMISGGTRFMGRHWSADVGLWTPLGVDLVRPFILANFAYAF
jgi:hypothetical protein